MDFVEDEHDCLTQLVLLVQDIDDRLPRMRVHTGEGFVKKDQIWISHEGARRSRILRTLSAQNARAHEGAGQ